MAKSRTKSNQRLAAPQRAYRYNTNRRLLRDVYYTHPMRHPAHLYGPKPIRSLKRLRRLAPYVAASIALSGSDRRQWAPAKILGRKWNGTPSYRLALPRLRPRQAVYAANGGRMAMPSQVAFAEPHKLVVCIQRKTRREVMFAKNNVGKSQSRRSMTAASGVKC